LARELALALVVRHVAPHRHEVPDVVGEQIEPLFVPALVQQLGLAVQEVLDLLPDEQTVDVTHCFSWGPRHGPQTPIARTRAGKAVARLGVDAASLISARPSWPPP